MERSHNELKKGLIRITEQLNEERGLYNRYITGQKFSLEIEENDEFFKIIKTYRDKRNGIICAGVRISEGKLDGLIVPMKSAKPVAKFLHAFAHRYNLPMVVLGASLEYSF